MRKFQIRRMDGAERILGSDAARSSQAKTGRHAACPADCRSMLVASCRVSRYSLRVLTTPLLRPHRPSIDCLPAPLHLLRLDCLQALRHRRQRRGQLRRIQASLLRESRTGSYPLQLRLRLGEAVSGKGRGRACPGLQVRRPSAHKFCTRKAIEIDGQSSSFLQ